jgi:drug/metabolite transporter (DMT)-like permease
MSGAFASILFVLIWSTGFVAARAAIPHADPQLFLLVRMVATAGSLFAVAAVARERFMPRGRIALHLALGMMLPGFYLCASWWAVQNGMPAGIMSLLGALQPLPIALIAFAVFGERLPPRAVAGLAAGALGVALVLEPTIARGGAVGGALPAILAVAAVIAMTIPTIAQQRLLGGDPLLAACAIQNVGGALIGVVAYAWLGTPRWDNGAMLWATLVWSVAGLSIGGLVLLAWLVRRQDATRVSTLLLLVPALGAIEAWALFDEALSAIQIAGFVLALAGVLLARRRAPAAVEMV